MGNQISDLYNQVINEHRKYPRNKGLVPGYKTLHLKNPSCGDDVTVQVEIKDGNNILNTIDVTVNNDVKKANVFELYLRNLKNIFNGNI